jgi:Trk K+ transport system NAD-binding subunit
MVHRLWKRFRYRFDNTISRGTMPVILWLLWATVAVVGVGAFVLTVAGADIGDASDPGFLETYYQTMLRILDPGTFSGDAGWGLRLVTFIVTIFGITVAAVLIGLIATGIEGKVDELRRGRSPVVESDHTLVLGWSPRVFTVVSEIIEADESRADSAIVVLAAMDKQAMELEFAHRVRNTGRTRLVCRSGDPSSLHDLDRVGIDGARSVVVLADVDAEEGDGDAHAVKTVLAALIKLGDRDVPVVAELNEAETGQALREAGPGRVQVVRAPEIIARVTAQACRQPGLSAVWQDLLDFSGDEIYFFPADDLVGHTFGEAQLAFERAAVIGRRAADGEVTLNPGADVGFEQGDAVIVIAEDDDAIAFTGFAADVASAGAPSPTPDLAAEHILLIGWNGMAPTILRELDRFVPTGSTVDVLVDGDLFPVHALAVDGLHRIAMDVLPADKANLDCLADQVTVKDYDVVLILGYRSLGSAASADARTLLTLLLVQQAATSPLRVVTELLDSADIELAMESGGDDYVVSDALSGYLMAQLAENPELSHVFDALFEGTDVVLRLAPAADYALGPNTFAALVTAARARGEVALGHLRSSDMTITLNPAKSAAVDLTDADRVVVISRV